MAKSTQYYKRSINMLHPETVVQTFAPIEVAREMDNLCKSAFVWVPKGNGIWIIMEVAFL